MKWCRYHSAEGPRFAMVEDEEAFPVYGNPFGLYEFEGPPLLVSELRLLPPCEPRTFFCAGLNYHGHVARANAAGHVDVVSPQRPEVGYRANSALIGAGDAIVRPADYAHPMEAEGELVAVIGKPLRHATRDEAADAIFGWTVGNDVTARQWQRGDRTLWRSKNSDTFKPMGPFIVTDVDPLASTTVVCVDGREEASFPTGDMIFDPLDYLCEISRYITLSPGDVLWMGTDHTAEFAPGSTVAVTISGIGTLSNPVVEENLP